MTRILKVLIALMVASLLLPGGFVATAQGGYCASSAEGDMLWRINQYRQSNGLAPVTLSVPLGAAAEIKSQDMASRNYFGHISPTGRGPGDILDTVGYPGNALYGEILAAGNPDAASTFEQWRNSQVHRDIILDGRFTAVGIARVDNPDSRYTEYWTAMFGNVVVTPADVCGGSVAPPPSSSTTNALIARLIAILQAVLNNR